MDCQASDSKKLFKVFEASKRKRTRKKSDGVDDSNSLITDGSTSGCQATVCRASSAKASLQNVPTSQIITAANNEKELSKRERDSSPALSQTRHHVSRSPHRHRRNKRESLSLALKAGMVSTPRSVSPILDDSTGIEQIPRDQDSFIYEFLEEAIKKEKKKHRHTRRTEEDYEVPSKEHRHHHHHRRRRDTQSPEERSHRREGSEHVTHIDPNVIYETFAKLCVQLSDQNHVSNKVQRTQSHKSLQCEDLSKRDLYDVNQRPVKLESIANSRDNVAATRIRSVENVSNKGQDDYLTSNERNNSRHAPDYIYERDAVNYDIHRNNGRPDYRGRGYPTQDIASRSRAVIKNYDYYGPNLDRNNSDYIRERRQNPNEDILYGRKVSRSFDVQDQRYNNNDSEENGRLERTGRTDRNRDKERIKRYDETRDKRYYGPRDVRNHIYDERDRYYESRTPTSYKIRDDLINKNNTSRRKLDNRFDRISMISGDRDRYSEREKDSIASGADEDASVVSARSNYLRVVKQEISEQREAMDKMMQLWKELMRCFKGISQNQEGNKNDTHEAAASHARESAATHLRLWQECMRRYETVARDVGDTDARLMEEINKQRSEMTEMSSMWQECLQRYREMSTDFNNLKQKLVVPEIPTRMPPTPLTCVEGESPPMVPAYSLPPHSMAPPGMMYPNPGSPLRSRASVPPAWWWCDERAARPLRRRSSPDSRGSCDRNRHHRHKERDRDDGRYKEKSKPNPARSEHRHRKR